MSAKRKPRQFPSISPTVEQTAAVKARIEAAASKPGFWEAFPEFREAVDALPDLEPLLGCVMELRPVVLDGYRWAGCEVPTEVWEALGVGRFAR